ncbi:MAG: M15 family metallopeptidase [Psychrobacter pacificensis]|jgi:peptidoglycan L-alanyl-D-glutamate endopeptidase CwlK|uniref:M15 family metallopeptidase n=1 Tax=Psychrobacter pacificensis TaxID=112002 RepID=UPI0023946FD8|nr:M15 family metallopeptidase [Psychrobacter pacificensis]MDE0843074.1 M15 family metallopeptidase [Psychrobacter pacificensis]|tara:strand:- start:12762 stop:13343 length:582 start_codon:yes stop_codon:yes gene_type:complete
MRESTIKNLQATMKSHGFYEGLVDGNWGNQSHAGFYAMAEAAIHCKAHSDDDAVNNEIKPAEPTGKYKLSAKSLARLDGLHPDLVKVVKRAIEITTVDFSVGEGLRSITRQKELYTQGATKTMNSRHLTGHAVDLFALDEAGKVTWDWDYYLPLASAVKQAATELGVTIEWGGDWKTFKDGPHYQLPWSKYSK